MAQSGVLKKVTTDASGQAVFSNLRTGQATVTVEAADHTTLHYITDLKDIDLDTNHYNDVRYASTLAILFPISGPDMATISGIIEADYDLTDTDLDPVVGKKFQQ